MLETSTDLLLIVLAFCALWLTVFISWVIYYFAQILRQANQLITDFRERLSLIDTVLKTIKEKLESSSSHLAFLVEGVRELLKYLQERKSRQGVKRTLIKKK